MVRTPVCLLAALAWPLTTAAAQAPLPDGPGKEAVQAYCTQCHSLARVVGAGHTPQEWRTVVDMMVNTGAKLPHDQVPVVSAYLAAHFPPRNAPKPVLIAGPVRVHFTEWALPTPGSRPHDPLAARDGSIWATGPMAHVARTGEIGLIKIVRLDRHADGTRVEFRCGGRPAHHHPQKKGTPLLPAPQVSTPQPADGRGR